MRKLAKEFEYLNESRGILRKNKNINEGYETVNWRHFDNDKRRYDDYVLVRDYDGAIIYNYHVFADDFWKDTLEEAIEDANDLTERNGYKATYTVYGCENNEYDESTLIFSTNRDLQEFSRLINNVNEGRLQGYPIPGYKAAHNANDLYNIDIDSVKIKQREKLRDIAKEMIKDTEKFPMPDSRTRIELSEGWSVILSNCLFEKSDMLGLVSITLGYGGHKEYSYGCSRYYKDYDDMLKQVETVIDRATRVNNLFDIYVYNKLDELREIKYRDNEFKNVKHYDVMDM